MALRPHARSCDRNFAVLSVVFSFLCSIRMGYNRNSITQCRGWVKRFFPDFLPYFRKILLARLLLLILQDTQACGQCGGDLMKRAGRLAVSHSDRLACIAGRADSRV